MVYCSIVQCLFLRYQITYFFTFLCENLSFRVSIRDDSNRPAELQRLARGLKILDMETIEGLYY